MVAMEDGFSLQHTTIGVVGLGLMGGSLALALKGKCARLLGFDTHPPTLELALSRGIIDHPLPLSLLPSEEGKGAQLDILILAVPVPAILDLLHQLALTNYLSPIIILDLGSTKREILRAMAALPNNFDPLGGHPICGKEKLGPENADPALYQGAPFILTPLERTTQRAIRLAKELISAVGAHPLEINADEHDRTLAFTSHLPFLIASALALSTPPEFAPLAGPGFRSTSRLAGTPAHMMLGILQSNRDHILETIQAFQTSLDKLRIALQCQDDVELENLLNQSRSNYQSIIDSGTSRQVKN